MKRIMLAMTFALFLVTANFAATDVTGQWAGRFDTTVDGETKEDKILLVLKQSGNELTGTAGPSSDRQWPILNGKLDGNRVTFNVQTPEPLIKFDLTLVDGHLKGNASAEHEGRSMKAVIDAQRKVD